MTAVSRHRLKAHVRRPKARHIVVLGLGRFGQAFVREALELGYDVVAADIDVSLVAELSEEFPYCVAADSTSKRALSELSVENAELVLVATGSDVEASILAVATLVELNAPKIWAKARSTRHCDILLKIGAHRVSQPETSEGTRLAHQLRDGTHEFVPLDDGFNIVEVEAPELLVGLTLRELALRRTYEVTLVAVKHQDRRFSHADASTVIESGDLLVVAGATKATERFLQLR